MSIIAKGKDITKTFFADQEANYANGNLNLIVDALGAGNLVIIERDMSALSTTDSVMPRSILNFTATGFQTRYYKNGLGQQIANKLTVYAQGRYTVNDSIHQITSASAPTVDEGSSYATPSAGFTYPIYYQSTSPSATINTAKTMVTFRLPYYSELYSNNYPIPLGFLTDTLTFTATV